jgi:hypothetical protein
MNAPAPAAGAGVASAAPGPGAAAAAPAPAQPPALSASTPAAASAPAVPRCDNCGASVPGRYCGTCGQRLEPPIHSLWHFTKVAAEDVTHADSRLWRTLWALLCKPGFLTREFFDGRRARYLPPVRLYLVLSVLFFVWIAATGRGPEEAHVTPDARSAIDQARQAAGSGHDVVIVIPHASERGAASGTAPAAAPKSTFSGSSLEGDKEHCKLIRYDGPWQSTIQTLLYRGCVQTAEDHGRSLVQGFIHNLPRAMFLFLPLLAAVMMLLYWHPRHYYVEHLLFFVHNHAFAFLVLMIAGTLTALLPFAAPLIGWVTVLYVVWYVFRSMRVMYGQSRLRTFGKLAFMFLVYVLAGSLMLAATALYAFATL